MARAIILKISRKKLSHDIQITLPVIYGLGVDTHIYTGEHYTDILCKSDFKNPACVVHTWFKNLKVMGSRIDLVSAKEAMNWILCSVENLAVKILA